VSYILHFCWSSVRYRKYISKFIINKKTLIQYSEYEWIYLNKSIVSDAKSNKDYQVHVNSSVLDAYNCELCVVEGLTLAQEIQCAF
jgi:hypothetical protein